MSERKNPKDKLVRTDYDSLSISDQDIIEGAKFCRQRECGDPRWSFFIQPIGESFAWVFGGRMATPAPLFPLERGRSARYYHRKFQGLFDSGEWSRLEWIYRHLCLREPIFDDC